jgi:hypothetical protein
MQRCGSKYPKEVPVNSSSADKKGIQINCGVGYRVDLKKRLDSLWSGWPTGNFEKFYLIGKKKV